MQVGTTELKAGYITQAKYIRGQSTRELDNRLGYRSGRLAKGWTMLFLLDQLMPEDFEFHGYTQMSGGVPQGHLKNPPDNRTAEQRLLGEGFDVEALKRKVVRETFRYSGPDRLCKVVPTAGEFGENDYPAGTGIPQWRILKNRPKRFKVAAIIGPNRTYTGNYT